MSNNSILDQINILTVEMRKQKDSNMSFMSWLKSEIVNVGKNSGNRETTYDETVQLLKKISSRLEETSDLEPSESKAIQLDDQLDIVYSLLPRMVSETEIKTFLSGKDLSKSNFGNLMKEMKTKWGSLVDMKDAKEIIEELRYINEGNES